jgi:hypothetical protein
VPLAEKYNSFHEKPPFLDPAEMSRLLRNMFLPPSLSPSTDSKMARSRGIVSRRPGPDKPLYNSIKFVKSISKQHRRIMSPCYFSSTVGRGLRTWKDFLAEGILDQTLVDKNSGDGYDYSPNKKETWLVRCYLNRKL